ncbi:hypothetical protein HGRIS_002952 [Hohenbuehelia grisea]|uniref:Uncharacterized protein n=1 Tax=Hohenbuehelia grisea TaxID=104357 RepID=A0ABR3JM10_9AGAR
MIVSTDNERQRYSQELAAYTMRQWTAARQSLDRMRAVAVDEKRFMTPAELAYERSGRASHPSTQTYQPPHKRRSH